MRSNAAGDFVRLFHEGRGFGEEQGRPEAWLHGDDNARAADLAVPAQSERETPIGGVPPGDEVLSIEELARRFTVSTKTISRWRDHGLVAQR